MQDAQVENDLLPLEAMLLPEPCRVDGFERLVLGRISDDADAARGYVQVHQVPSVLLRQCDEVVEPVGSMSARRNVVHLVKSSLEPAASVETAVHVQNRRDVGSSTDARAHFTLWLSIAVRMNDVEAAPAQGRNHSGKEPVVTDVEVALETVDVDTTDDFRIQHFHRRSTGVRSVGREDVDLVTSVDELFRD
jgi:hypothetical protein